MPKQLHVSRLLVLALDTSACQSTDTAAGAPVSSQPVRWPIVYQQDFVHARALQEFACSDPECWEWHHQGSEHGLKLLGNSKYQPKHRSPTSIALLQHLEVADFDLDVDVKQTGRNYGHRDLCLFFGFQSPQRFYYTHLATKPDPNAHNIFRVQDAPRTNLCAVPAAGIDWGDNEWHHVRVERRIQAGGSDAYSIKVFWDQQEQPILETTDKHFAWGRIGFGSFDDSGILGNIVVRAPMSRSVSGKSNPF